MIQSATLREVPAPATRLAERRLQRSAWPAWAAITGIVGAGAALRFWNLTAGFPYRIGVDEPVIAEHAIHMMKSGDFNPHFFDYPGLYIYVQLLVACVRFLAGSVDGLWHTLNQFHATDLFAWTRALSAMLGTMTIVVVYRAGLRWGQWVALLAAALLAVWPNHVRESHFALTDVPLALLATVVLVLSLQALETGRLAWVIAAGACAGFAAATKYSGAVALVMPVIAALAREKSMPVRAWSAIAAIGVGAGTFLLGAPYTVLDLPAFLNSFGALMVAFRPRPFMSGTETYLTHLRVALGWPGLIVAVGGIAWGIFRAVQDRDLARWAMVIVFPLIYFHVIATKHLIYARYMLPILPFLCLIMAVALMDALGWISRLRQPWGLRAAAATVLFASVLVHPVIAGVSWPIRHGRPTTQDIAYSRIRDFIPEGSGVAVERSVLRLPETRYRAVDFLNLAQRSRQQYLASGITFLVASSDSFGQVFDQRAERPDVYQAYQRLLHDGTECLPPVQPTASIPGAQILICRLLPN